MLRSLCLLLFVLFFLSGCSYSAKSVMTVAGGSAGNDSANLEHIVKALRRHRDGCFSKRNATMLITGTGQQREYLISNKFRALDLRLSVEKSRGGVLLELNEWSEKYFSTYAAGCYQQLKRRLAGDFGKSRITVVESCDNSACRSD